MAVRLLSYLSSSTWRSLKNLMLLVLVMTSALSTSSAQGRINRSINQSMSYSYCRPGDLAQWFLKIFNVYASCGRALRSESTSRLVAPPIKLSIVDSRSFPVAAAQVWNGLSEAVVSSSSLQTFRRHLRTHLFQLSYPHLIFDRLTGIVTVVLVVIFVIKATLKIYVYLLILLCLSEQLQLACSEEEKLNAVFKYCEKYVQYKHCQHSVNSIVQ